MRPFGALLATSAQALGLVNLPTSNRKQLTMVFDGVFPTLSRGKAILEQSAYAVNRLLALVLRIEACRFNAFIDDARFVRRLEAFGTTHP